MFLTCWQLQTYFHVCFILSLYNVISPICFFVVFILVLFPICVFLSSFFVETCLLDVY